MKDSDFVNWMRPSAVPRVPWRGVGGCPNGTTEREKVKLGSILNIGRPIAFHKLNVSFKKGSLYWAV